MRVLDHVGCTWVSTCAAAGRVTSDTDPAGAVTSYGYDAAGRQVTQTAAGGQAERLGYDKHDPAGRNGQNPRNGGRSTTVMTEVGPVELDVPHDREGSFEPKIVKKRQRRLDGVDQIVLSLTARRLTTGEVAAHFADVYNATVSKDTVSWLTDKVIGEMAEWQPHGWTRRLRCLR